METKDSIHPSLEARLDDLDRKVDQMADRASRASVDAESHLPSQLKDVRQRSNEARKRLHTKQDADDRVSDQEFAYLGREIDNMQAELDAHQE